MQTLFGGRCCCCCSLSLSIAEKKYTKLYEIWVANALIDFRNGINHNRPFLWICVSVARLPRSIAAVGEFSIFRVSARAHNIQFTNAKNNIVAICNFSAPKIIYIYRLNACANEIYGKCTRKIRIEYKFRGTHTHTPTIVVERFWYVYFANGEFRWQVAKWFRH